MTAMVVGETDIFDESQKVLVSYVFLFGWPGGGGQKQRYVFKYLLTNPPCTVNVFLNRIHRMRITRLRKVSLFSYPKPKIIMLLTKAKIRLSRYLN